LAAQPALARRTAVSSSLCISDDEDDTTAASLDEIVDAREIRNTRKFEKIRRTATPRQLEAGPWYKKTTSK